ncbi:MAG: hypothetical protein HQM08_00985 [Candidatus Riflebacteria bacterium]|nr:hypothetical protein [Candidatus Riflebacteria bacterium]
MEIIIAASILCLAFGGFFSIFRSGANSFNQGEWRISTQKSAQSFLSQVREDIEKANSPYRVLADGTTTIYNQIPIYIANKALNTNMSGTNSLLASVGISIPVSYYSITTPYVDSSPFVAVASPGLWLGCSMVFVDRKLFYRRTGDPILHSTDPIPQPSGINTFPSIGVLPTGQIRSNLQNPLFKELDDVDSIAFYNLTTTTEQTIEIRLSFSRKKSGQPPSPFKETVVARLLAGNIVSPF